MPPITQFTDAAAVEAWDAWFRWRDAQGLRDRTIASTWARVAGSIATAEGASAGTWSQRYVRAFNRWRLLPDERLLRSAGTGVAPDLTHPAPAAVVNVAKFVSAPSTARARLESQALADMAALAVRLLDDAWIGAGSQAPDAMGAEPPGLRIGPIGMAGALERLGIGYGSIAAIAQAREVASALAVGTLRGSVELARERGPVACDLDCLEARWRARGMPEPLIADALRWGVRHERLTCIDSHPRLALLADNASDALDPVTHRSPARLDGKDRDGPHASAAGTLRAQIELRAAMQPWIDAPIDYPLILVGQPAQTELDLAARLSERYRLPALRFRFAGADVPQALASPA